MHVGVSPSSVVGESFVVVVAIGIAERGVCSELSFPGEAGGECSNG